MQPNRARIAKHGPDVAELSSRPDQLLDDNEIGLMELINALRRYKAAIIGSVVAALLVATYYCFTQDNIYRAEVTLAPAVADDNKSTSVLRQLGNVVDVSGLNLDSPNHNAMALAILRSRAFTSQFIQDEKLALVLLDQGDSEPPDDLSRERLKWQAYSRFNSLRKINVDHKNSVITLSIEWTDPEQAALWANRLIQRLNHHMQDSAIEEAEKSIIYLNEQLGKTSVIELQSVIYRLIEGHIKKITLANVNDQYAFKVIDPAVPPQQHIKPRRSLVMALSVITGLMLGVFLAFLLNFIKKIKIAAETS